MTVSEYLVIVVIWVLVFLLFINWVDGRKTVPVLGWSEAVVGICDCRAVSGLWQS